MTESCLILKNIEKEELISAITDTLGTHVLQLMTTQEAADLMQVSVKTVIQYKNTGLLTDYSRKNEHRKFSAAEVLNLRRMEAGERRKLYAKTKQVH